MNHPAYTARHSKSQHQDRVKERCIRQPERSLLTAHLAREPDRPVPQADPLMGSPSTAGAAYPESVVKSSGDAG